MCSCSSVRRMVCKDHEQSMGCYACMMIPFSIPNLRVLANIFLRTNNQPVVGTSLGKAGLLQNGIDASYENPRNPPMDPEECAWWFECLLKLTYHIYPMKKDSFPFADFSGKKMFHTFGELDKSLFQWSMCTASNNRCGHGQ